MKHKPGKRLLPSRGMHRLPHTRLVRLVAINRRMKRSRYPMPLVGGYHAALRKKHRVTRSK